MQPIKGAQLGTDVLASDHGNCYGRAILDVCVVVDAAAVGLWLRACVFLMRFPALRLVMDATADLRLRRGAYFWTCNVTHAISSRVTLEVRPIVDTTSNCATPWCVSDDAVDGPATLDGDLIMGLMHGHVTPGVCLIMETVYGRVTLDGYLKIDASYGCTTAWTYCCVRSWTCV